MSPQTAIALNLPPRPPPSSIVESAQRSPVLSPRIVDPRPQRLGSVRPPSPPSPPRRIPTPPPPPPLSDREPEKGPKEEVRSHDPPIDKEAFQQIVDLDEDDDSHEFSWEMVQEYFAQAGTTFTEMKEAIDNRECKKLSSLGHFLKGSSATLGVIGVREKCELIQNYGNLMDETGKALSSDDALSNIAAALEEAEVHYKQAQAWLKNWFEEARPKARAD